MRKPGPASIHTPDRVHTRSVSADEYIRRLDRLLVVTSVIIVALAATLFAQTL